MDAVKELLSNAQIAFTNKQYAVALDWYQKVLETEPDNMHALSRAGALCVPMGKFAEALTYFGHAYELDPGNGDNAFNYANACFFSKDYPKALAMYTEAKNAGCSEDVLPRLYYQMALLCSMREDIASALLYLEKCEEADKTGKLSLNPDMISEKLKLYMLQKDYTNAEKCAAQLVAINPRDFKNYMVLFSLLMSHKRYEAAQALLSDAGKYAQLDDDNRFALVMQEAALYMAMADAEPEKRTAYCEKAIALLQQCQMTNSDQRAQASLSTAESYIKMEKYDDAICLLLELLEGPAVQPIQSVADFEDPGELTEEQLEEMASKDMQAIQDKIDTGVLSGDMGLYADTDYDDEGNAYHVYDPAAFVEKPAAPETEQEAPVPQQNFVLSDALQEKAVFTLLTCYLAKDDFANASVQAKRLKRSENKYYHYYGIYTEALTERKISGNTDIVQRKYAEAIAFFRNQTFKDAADTLATIFRARLYAEQGSYEKAKELAHLLAEADQQSLLQYIDQCKG